MSPAPAAPPQSMADRQIERAKRLEARRHELGKEIAANRDLLRLMEKGGELANDQADWLEFFYPEKEKGERRDASDIEQTRKLKEEARKAYASDDD